MLCPYLYSSFHSNYHFPRHRKANIKEETQRKIAEAEAAKAKRGLDELTYWQFFFPHISHGYFAKDKIEEAQAKARVREQIEADKQARREKAEREKAYVQKIIQYLLATL